MYIYIYISLIIIVSPDSSTINEAVGQAVNPATSPPQQSAGVVRLGLGEATKNGVLSHENGDLSIKNGDLRMKMVL